MEATFESIFDSTKMLLKHNNILDKTCEEKLNKVREIEQHLQAVNDICKTELRPEENQGAMTVKNTCKAVAYGGYIKEKTDAAGLVDTVSKMKIETFPESIQPKGYQIKGYIEGIIAQLEEVDDLINKIEKMVVECRRNQFKLSETERIDLEMIKLEFDGGLEICSNYQEQAMKALKELKSEVDSYQQRQESAANRKKKYVAVAGAGAGLLAGGAVATYNAMEAGATALACATGATGGGCLTGGVYGWYSVDCLTTLLVGAAVSVIGLYLVYKRWAATRQFCDELLLTYRNYTDLINESQSISDRLKCIARN